MESSNSNSSTPSGGQEGEKGLAKSGGGNLEKCSREELITKCRNLLALAQRAKSAKDEATIELKKVKASMKNADAIAAEADALREMVADLTEGKVVYTTKIESLQRQLKVSSSEVDSLRVAEQDLLKERNQLIAENNQLAEEENRYKEKLQTIKESWEKEKLALEERVENLEAQTGQVDILKTKCKKLLEEKTSVEGELQKQQKLVAKSIKLQGELTSLKEEKKANAIILEAAKSEKKALEEKLKKVEGQFATLQRGKEEEDKNVKLDHAKVQELEEVLSKHKSLLSLAETSLEELQEKFANLQQEKDHLQATFEETQKNSESADHRFKLLEDELRRMSENKLQLEKQVEELESENGHVTQSYTAEIENLKSELMTIKEENREQQSTSDQKFQKEKIESLEKIKQYETDSVHLKDQINVLQEQLKAKDEQTNQLSEKLKEKQSEICDFTEKLTRMESENVNLADRNRTFEEHHKQIEELKEELQILSGEKTEIHQKCESLETDVKLLREQLENVLKLKQNLENEISKYQSEADTKLKEEVEQKETLNRLTSEITDLKSLNSELAGRAEQLQNNVKANESVLSELSCSGNSLLSVCRKLYPSSQHVLPLDIEGDTGKIMKSILELFNLVASKQVDSKYEENLEIVSLEVDKFLRHCKSMEVLDNGSEWNLHAECFERLTSSLINFYNSVVLVMDACNEENSSYEDKCRDVSSVYNKFCENMKQESIKWNNLKKEVEDLNKEKLKYEQRLAEAGNEKDAFSVKVNELQAKLVATEKRCADLETQITSGDSEKEEIVNNLRRQLLESSKEKEMLNEKFKDTQAEKNDLEKCLEKQREEIENICAEKKLVQTEKEHLESNLESFKSQSSTKEKCLFDEKQDLEKKLTMLSEEKINLEKEFASLNADKRSLEEESDKEKRTIHEKVKVLLEEQGTREQEIEKLRAENSKLQDTVLKLQTRIEELNSEVHQFQDAVKSMDQTIQTLKSETETSEKNLKEVQNQNLQLNSSVDVSSSRCEELLSELNNMNKVLRERGERISRLEAANKDKSEQLEFTKNQLEELQNKMSSSEAELASKREQLQTITEKLQSFSSDSTVMVSSNESQEITKLQDRLKELEEEKDALNKTIHGLECELQSSRESAGPCHDGQSEVMSTSTISRAEDSQRMKELEDTFEERYMKLKSVAIRLKKRVAELTAQLNSSEENRTKLVTEKEDLKKKVDGGTKDSIKATSKNIQIMQGEIDRLQDEVDSKKKELKEFGKQLTAAAEQLANIKSELADSQEENGTLLKTIKNQEESLSVQRDESASLRGQIAALEKRLAAESEQQQSVEERRKKAEERMEEERQKAKQYAKELEEAKQDSKNKSLMDLEMRDYELTVEELNIKLGEKDATIMDLQADIVREKGRSCSLQDQLTHLTIQEATERERAEKMKKLLLEHKTQLAELRHTQEVQIAAQENDRVTIEELTQELEKQKLVMSEISNEKTKLENTVRKTKSTSERQIEVLEDQLTKYKTEAAQLKTELNAIQKEFEGYKVRATSVLRQKARAPEVDVNELKGEKDQLQEDYEAAQIRMQQLQSELSALRAEHSFLQSEKEGIARQVSSLTDDLNRRETLHRERVTNLESKIEAKVSEYQLIIASMSSQNETMSNSFKKQLESMRQTHSREVEELATKLEDAEDKIWQLKNTISTSVTSTNSSTATGLAVSHPLRSETDQGIVLHNHSSQHRRQPSSHGCEEPRIDVSNMVREEGEGSEWVEPVHRSPGRPGGYSPPPLEQLISSPLPSNVGLPPQEDTISIASINTDITSKEIARLESKVTSAEMRIHQLTSLLHESEAENAKLAQLSDALKEEIRRSSRNESREKHMENMEYMKNIILKFLVTKNGEERKHMVPVLKTVLQLSPQETSDLEHFAVGGEEGGGTQGWSTYLHLWSSR